MSSSTEPSHDPNVELDMLRGRVRELEAEQRRSLADDPAGVLVQLSRSSALTHGDLESAFGEITEAAAAVLSVGRVGIWMFEEDRSAIQCHNLFINEPRQHTSGHRITAADCPRYFAALEEDRSIAAHDARADPRTSEFTEGYLDPNGITSMLDAPVRVGGRPVGIVCHEHVGPMRRWTTAEKSFAASVADLVAIAMHAHDRWLAEESAKRSERRLRQVIDLVPHMIFAKTRESRFLLANRAVADAYGTTVEALTSTTHRDLHIDDAELEAMLEDDRQVVERAEPLFIPEEPFTGADGITRIVQTTKIPFTESGTGEPAMLGIAVDITDRKQAEQRLHLMLQELDHRVKNNLAAVLAIADQTIASSDSLESFAPAFRGRIRALSVVHEALARMSWQGAKLGELVNRLMAPHRPPGHDRITVDGPEVMLPASVAPVLAMTLHELAVNSTKYGSLSVAEGWVHLEWAVRPAEHGGGTELDLRWRERGGPPVQRPERSGFGTTMIEQLVAYQLKGEVRLAFEAEGVECRVRCPMPSSGNGAGPASDGSSGGLSGGGG